MEKERQVKIYPKQAQAAIEYLIIFGIVLAAIFATGFISRMNGANGICENFFNKAVEAMR